MQLVLIAETKIIESDDAPLGSGQGRGTYCAKTKRLCVRVWTSSGHWSDLTRVAQPRRIAARDFCSNLESSLYLHFYRKVRRNGSRRQTHPLTAYNRIFPILKVLNHWFDLCTWLFAQGWKIDDRDSHDHDNPLIYLPPWEKYPLIFYFCMLAFLAHCPRYPIKQRAP